MHHQLIPIFFFFVFPTIASVVHFTRNNSAIYFTQNKFWELKPDFLNFLRFAEFKRRKRIVCKANLINLLVKKSTYW